MKYFFYLINVFCLMNYHSGSDDIFDKHLWGADISVKREIIFMDGLQLSGDVNLGYLIPLGTKYIFSKKNLKESLMPYWFMGVDFTYHVNNFYSGFLELEKVSFKAGTMVDFQNIYAYKFAFTLDFDIFFMQFQIVSSSLNVFKKKEVIKYIGIAIGKSFSSYDSIWNVPIAMSFFPRKVRRIDSPKGSLVAVHRLNLYKINHHVLDVQQEVLDNEHHAKIVSDFTCLTKKIGPGEKGYLKGSKKICYQIRKQLVAIEPFFDQYQKDNEDYKVCIDDILSKYRAHVYKKHYYEESLSGFYSKLIEILHLIKEFYISESDKEKSKSFLSKVFNIRKKMQNNKQALVINIDIDSIKAFDLNNEKVDGMSINNAFKEFYKRILFEILIYSNLDEREAFKRIGQSDREKWLFLE